MSILHGARLASHRDTYLAGFLDGGTVGQRIGEWYSEFDNVNTTFLKGEHDVYCFARVGVSSSDECHKCRALLIQEKGRKRMHVHALTLERRFLWR
jgi:hypothetical protein